MKTTKLICVPAYFHPLEQLNFSSCSVVQGVRIAHLTGELKNTITSFSKKLPREPGFGVTHAICIEEAAYWEGVSQRLQTEGASLPARTLLESESIAKQTIISFLLAGPISFAFRGAHSLTVATHGRRKIFTPTGYSHGPLYQISGPMQGAIFHENETLSPIDPRKVRAIAEKLDKYFRSGRYWHDRLSMAIGYFWDALCTPFSQQAYIGLMNALECLLTTKTLEITHSLAERTAVLITKDPESRMQVYNDIKNLYQIRSKIVHGTAFPKKGAQLSESLYISAKSSQVPISALGKLVRITISSITAVLCNAELLKIIQTLGKEEKIDRKIDKYFLKLLFGA